MMIWLIISGAAILLVGLIAAFVYVAWDCERQMVAFYDELKRH